MPAAPFVAIAPQALVPLSLWSLIAGTPQPTGLDLVGVELRMRLAADGALSLTRSNGHARAIHGPGGRHPLR